MYVSVSVLASVYECLSPVSVCVNVCFINARLSVSVSASVFVCMCMCGGGGMRSGGGGGGGIFHVVLQGRPGGKRVATELCANVFD